MECLNKRMGFFRKRIKKTASSATDDDDDANIITSLNVELLKLSTESRVEYDPEDHMSDHWCVTTLSYNGKEIFTRSDTSTCNIGGRRGYEHTASFSSNKKKLIIHTYEAGQSNSGNSGIKETFDILKLVNNKPKD